ncbi:MAG: hypothetical protein HQ546_08480 [Planctomycetes bacterium]|nr:hypothetical protein [Planctomycetota bacterium]
MLAIVTVLLILGIIYFQSTQGLFSSLIMAICTLVCTVLAFTYYEPLARAFLYARIPAQAEAAGLIGLLIIPLLIVRLLIDRYLPGNVVPGVWIDRIGGGLFGLVTALLLVGTLMTAVQMLPFGRSVIGYNPYNDDLQPASGLGINAPGFTLAVVKGLSGGSLARSPARPLSKRHDNIIMELWAARNRRESWSEPTRRTRYGQAEEQTKAVSRNNCTQGSLKKVVLYDVTGELYPQSRTENFASGAPAYPLAEYAGKLEGFSRVYVVRATVGEDARDGDNWWRLMGTHFRLVTEDGESFYPVGYLICQGQWAVITDKVGQIQINRPFDDKKQIDVDLIYRVPFAPRSTEPRKIDFLAFRRIAVARLSEAEKAMPSPDGALGRKVVYDQVEIVVPAGGVSSAVLFVPESARVDTTMPVRIKTDSRDGQVDIQRDTERALGTLKSGKWVEGTIEGRLTALVGRIGGDGNAVDSLAALDGWKVVKLVGKGASSGLAQFLTGQLADIAMQPTVKTVDGRTYAPAGGWVTYNRSVDGKSTPFIHMYYTTDQQVLQDPSGRANQGLNEVKNTFRKNVESLTEFGLIFLVPDNCVLASFELAGSGPTLYCKSPLNVGDRPYTR